MSCISTDEVRLCGFVSNAHNEKRTLDEPFFRIFSLLSISKSYLCSKISTLLSPSFLPVEPSEPLTISTSLEASTPLETA